ncbi:hypothetical protein WDZ92_34200 [Nostoc sp. NIES-2111]
MAEKDVSLQSQLILCDAAAPVDALRQYLGRSNLFVSRTESVLLLHLHLHGVAAMPLLADLYGRAQEKAAIDAITALGARTMEARRSPAAVWQCHQPRQRQCVRKGAKASNAPPGATSDVCNQPEAAIERRREARARRLPGLPFLCRLGSPGRG